VPKPYKRAHLPQHHAAASELARVIWSRYKESEMMSLMRHQPWSFADRWQPDFEHLFRARSVASEPAGTWVPSVDVQEEGDRYVVRADVPGVEAKDIDISAEDGLLTIRGVRTTKERSNSDGFEHVECFTGTFLRRITLPAFAQLDSIKAHYTNGVLEIEIPKQARAEAKRITIPVN
jgi:HSP20 family protein